MIPDFGTFTVERIAASTYSIKSGDRSVAVVFDPLVAALFVASPELLAVSAKLADADHDQDLSDAHIAGLRSIEALSKSFETLSKLGQ